MITCTRIYFGLSMIQRMRQGVERDLERQKRKEENRRLLEEQLELQRKLEERGKHTHHKDSTK